MSRPSSGRPAAPGAVIAALVLVAAVAAVPRADAARAQAAPKAPIPTCLSFATTKGASTCARSNANFCAFLNSSMASCGFAGSSLLFQGLPPALTAQAAAGANGGDNGECASAARVFFAFWFGGSLLWSQARGGLNKGGRGVALCSHPGLG